ncbi:hypothetical protein YYE_04928 [Plasmodium vinckei vinckei]|uniref:Fam-a protein n=1 Tax=Plasmodium vinckei vinckei TaxID=54757 RepID=A0A081I962_PLAVN|nr:hypothetical protein YYE_04928 [Plasmodium vinckei vinckei]
MNKGYIKVVLALLSVAVYISNEEKVHQKSPTDAEEHEQVLDIDPEETKQAENIMTEALAHIQYHAENTDDYYLYSKEDEGAIIHFKKFNGTDIGKLELIIPNPDCYDDVVNMLWDLNGAKNFDDTFIKGIIQQRHKTFFRKWDGYYHALAGKAQLSEDTTAIILVSSNMNDHDHKNNKDYINPIVESANSFKPDIDSEEDIRNGKLSKTYINLVGFIIKQETDCIKITYLISIDTNTYFFIPSSIIRNGMYYKILDIVKLRNIFEKE